MADVQKRPGVVSLVMIQPHPAVLVCVGVPGNVHSGSVYDVGLLLSAVVRPVIYSDNERD